MTEIIWKQGKPKEHESYTHKKLFGTDRWNDKMIKTVSDTVMVTIERNGERFVDTSYIADGEWSGNMFLALHKDARVVAYADYPAPYDGEQK